jgi:hypothetical protein
MVSPVPPASAATVTLRLVGVATQAAWVAATAVLQMSLAALAA